MNDTTREIEVMQREIMLRMTPTQRITAASEMFMAAREMFLRSLPAELSSEEIKRALYYRTYGEHLPDDFFDHPKARE